MCPADSLMCCWRWGLTEATLAAPGRAVPTQLAPPQAFYSADCLEHLRTAMQSFTLQEKEKSTAQMLELVLTGFS